MMNGVRHGTEFPEQNQLKSGCQDCFAIVGGYSYNTQPCTVPPCCDAPGATTPFQS